MLACICGGIIELTTIGAVGAIVLFVNFGVGQYNRFRGRKQCGCDKPIYRFDPVGKYFSK